MCEKVKLCAAEKEQPGSRKASQDKIFPLTSLGLVEPEADDRQIQGEVPSRARNVISWFKTEIKYLRTAVAGNIVPWRRKKKGRTKTTCPVIISS